MNPEPTVARKVPPAERETRLANLRARLVGVLIEGHSEPSHSLLDAATQLYDQNVSRFIPLEKCYSRLTELSFTNKPQSKLLEVESSKVVIRDKDADFESSVQSSYQALEAFKRRGLALDFANVMSFTSHDKYVQLLFAHLNREPPSGYNRCSVSQLLAADKAAWCTLIEKNVKPRPDANGVLLLTQSLKSRSNHMRLASPSCQWFRSLLQKQRPCSHLLRRGHRMPSHRKGVKRDKTGSGPTQREKEKSKTKTDSKIPSEIRAAGGTASTPDGDPICFDYSLKKCKEMVTDGRCRKGYHLCCICYGPHCMLDHKKN